MASSEPSSSLGAIPRANSGVGSSDVRISGLFDGVSRALQTAKSSTDLTNLRRLLSDINFELTKYGDIALSRDAWRPKLEAFVNDVLRHVQIHPTFALDVRDIENDTAAMLDHILDCLVDATGAKSVTGNLQVLFRGWLLDWFTELRSSELFDWLLDWLMIQ